MSEEVTREMLDRAARELSRQDAVLASIIDQVGPCRLRPHADYFRALAEAIIHQQLSTKAAGTIARRFVALYPDKDYPSPEDVLTTPDETLRSVGLSNQKTRYLKDLSTRFLDGTIDPSGFATMTDDEIVEHLVCVKGIGRWTAEMFLIFSLVRPDVLPVDDLGLQKAVQRWYGVDPTPASVRAIAERWRPFRTVATWYMWRSLEIAPLESLTAD